MIRWTITFMQSDEQWTCIQMDKLTDGLMYQQMGRWEVRTDIQIYWQTYEHTKTKTKHIA